MDERDRNLLQDMRAYAQHGASFIAGHSLADFQRDLQLQFAVIRAIEVVGEAAWRVSAATRTELPTIAWPQMAGMRHRLIHGYGQLNLEIIYTTAVQFLPELIAQLDSALGDT